ncbi:hypothetical protein AC578_8677 [Pseudocercospora eumusae]|uniref:Uncharacterized protein n=1 Tax=Pseudocercospora eumusae TaxID=321146 RepID=A0A139HQ23_9PEZI|nr:hypothetical protein AC578_8677 [Pseudocercospora eumusae]
MQERATNEPSSIVVPVFEFDFIEAMRATDRLLIMKARVKSFPSDGFEELRNWLGYHRKLDEDDKYCGYETATIVSMAEAPDIGARVDMFLKTSRHFSIRHSILYIWEAKHNDAQEGTCKTQIIGFYEDGPECESDDDEDYEPEESDSEHFGDLGGGMKQEMDEDVEYDNDDEGDSEDMSEDEDVEAEELSVESLVELGEGVPNDYYDHLYYRAKRPRGEPLATKSKARKIMVPSCDLIC